MFETILQLQVPEYVDDFATDSILPVNIVAKIDMFTVKGLGTKVHVRAGDRMTTFEHPPASGEMILQIPISPSMEPSEHRIVVEVEDNRETVNAVRKVIKTTGVNNLYLESPCLADSLFVRMNTDCQTLTNDIMADEAMQYLRPWKSASDPTAVDACNFMENFLDYFRKFEYLAVSEPKGGLLGITGINDALEFNKADPITMGLIFCHVAYKMKLKPVLIMYRDTCIVGLQVLDNAPRVPVTEISVDDPDRCSMCNSKGKFVIMDLSELTSMEDSLKAAQMQFESHEPLSVCIVAYEKDKETYCREKYHSARGNTTNGWS